MSLAVLDPGLKTTVQDLGRPGYLRDGIPPSGPMDREAFLLANRLVGNEDNAAGLECTLWGPKLECRGEGLMAITGAEVDLKINGMRVPRWTALRVKSGDVIHVGQAKAGFQAYLALAGGIDLPPVLGSRATYLRGRLGGLEGRALKKGDLLPLGRLPFPLDGLEGQTVRPELMPSFSAEVEVRVILGPQDDCFTPEGIAAFLTGPYQVTPQADRMGYRLEGPKVPHKRGHDIVSDGIPLGGIQVVGEGQPIILLVDRQSTGGYTKIATVISLDIGRVAQARPGDQIRFRQISVAEAHRLLREAEVMRKDAIVGPA